MLVSAVVLNFNGEAYLSDCLTSLQNQTYRSIELVVVDNGSVDKSSCVVQQLGVTFVPTGRNLGLAQANNLAARLTKGDLLFFVNFDMRFDPECIARLAEPFLCDGSLFASDPLQYNWSGERIVHERTVLRPASIFRTVFPGLRADYLGKTSERVDIPWGCAGSLMVRRDRFLALGGFDPTFFLDFEDADLCWRAWRMGWRSAFVPKAKLWHRVGATSDPKLNPVVGATGRRRALSSRKNAQRFALKAFEPWRAAMTLSMFATKAAREAAIGRNNAAALTVRSLVDNLRELPEILAERRELNQGSHVSTAELIARFLGSDQLSRGT